MTLEQAADLARDAGCVHDALSTLMWWARGVVSGATTQRQTEVAERALSIAERYERTASVVAAGLDSLVGELEVAERGDAE